MLLEGTIFWVFKRKGDLIYGREALSGISKIFTPEASFQTCQRCGEERGKLLPWQCFGENGPANKYHLKPAWSKKMLRSTILFLFTNSSPRVCSQSQSRCHFWKCRIAKHTQKKSASFKNMVALSSYLLVENMCVLNTNYPFSSVFSSGNKTFMVQLWNKAKWYHRRTASTLEPAVGMILSTSL